MMENRSVCDRLYLFREDTSMIYVNNCQLLHQHQIDGLRFLFKQFHKKKHVAIVNFPEQCGKAVTVALFLNAIKSLLKKPVLIICNNQNEIESWKQIIMKWTNYNIDDIAMEATNVYIRKKIFLKSSLELTSYQRPNWSIVVVKNEISKPMHKLTFNADLKIWLASTDVKKDLNILAYTYKWLLPLSKTKSTMNIQDFRHSGDTVREKVEKAILLESFIEEFVMQQTKITPFNNSQVSNKETAQLSRNKEKTPQRSRKNKDATGTKIKRSRRIIEDDDIIKTHDNDVTVQNNANSIKNESDNHENEYNEDNMDSQNILLQYDNTVEHNNILNIENACLTKEDVKTKNDEIVKPINPSSVFNQGTECNDIQENLKENLENDITRSQENITDCSTDYNETQNNDIVNSGEKNDSIDLHTDIQMKSIDQNINLNRSEMDTGDIENKSDKITIEVLENIDNEKQGTDYKKDNNHDTDDIDKWEAKALKKFKGSLLDSIF